MRLPLRSCLVVLAVFAPPAVCASEPSAGATDAIAAGPNPAIRGELVTLRWYFGARKIVVSGGRFGAGKVVTGHTTLTDKPAGTTRYTFDVWYDPGRPADQQSETGSHSEPGQHEPRAGVAATAAGSTKLVHARYAKVVDVIDPQAMHLIPYNDSRGWRVHYLQGWERDNVSLPDPANNALMYFQPEEDSPERLAVAELPIQGATCDDVMKQVQADMPSHYSDVAVVSQVNVTQQDLPAVLATCTARDMDGHKLQTVVMAFIKDGHAYVVSARTPAARYAERQKLLTSMVRSFRFVGRPKAPVSAEASTTRAGRGRRPNGG